MPREPILIEGYTAKEILALPLSDLTDYVLSGRPMVFRVGSASVLGEAQIVGEILKIKLAHIDGGGEGVLRELRKVTLGLAERAGLSRISWVVYAAHCAHPNLKLRRVLLRRGFWIEDVDGTEAFRLEEVLHDARA